MNETIKSAVIKNEEKLLHTFPEYKSKIKVYIPKLKGITRDGTLYSFIHASFKDKEKQENDYNKKGYLSSRQIIESLKSELDFHDSVSFGSLSNDDLYSVWDICSLTGKFNYQAGMHYCENKKAVIIKTTTSGDDRPYPDYWINDSDLYYCMQKELKENRKRKEFSHKPNREIYNSLITDEYVPIYVFYNSRVGDLFQFAGVFHAIGISDDYSAFVLTRDSYAG